MNPHTGGNFDDFLEEDGILEEVSAKAHKRLLSMQLADIMREKHITANILAQRLNASPFQLEQLLDPENTAMTIESLEHIAHAVGKKLHIEFA
uniref:Helix-turn-helix domain-containing protein n=1 Tax=Candidatus Kentrum sp. SD TaxID=2126332 RepID=A0A451BJW6_9GAMM|nr:MAG: Helix-turn-helix domain-containing protein [Candidatus Kentron sp. SD]VFK40231.1 MAG: Helix-turn-helix domain-containing protein [Candidatus Kentron sp. SD]VFK78585.1 MAG: Helix-turn-helix domain-containing protein [Candidatus Kentron sp. SD]